MAKRWGLHNIASISPKLNAHKGGTSVDPAYRMRDAWPGDG